MSKTYIFAFISVIMTGITLGAFFIKISVLEKETSEQKLSPKPPSQEEKASIPPSAIPAPPSPEQIAKRTLTTRFQAGDYKLALAIAEEQAESPILSPAYKHWLGKQLPAILTSLAWTHVQRGECQLALKLLLRSLEKADKTETLKGLAYCYYKDKQWDQADEFMNFYLQREPHNIEMLLIYSDILESQARFEEASMVLESVKELSSDKPSVHKRLASMRAKLKESDLQASFASEHFLISYRAAEHDQLLNFVAETLEASLNRFVEAWYLERPREPIEIILYPKNKFGNIVSYGPKWAQGLFDGRVRIQISPEDLRRSAHDSNGVLARLLRHELVHALLAQKVDQRELPYWFNEGLAMFLECVNTCRSIERPIKPGQFLPKNYFLSRYTQVDPNLVGILYKQSLFLIQTIETINNNYEKPIPKIIQGLGISTDLQSDQILKPVGLDFQQLYTVGSQGWESGISKSSSPSSSTTD